MRNGILDIETSINEAKRNKTEFELLAANIKNPLKIMQLAEPLGSTFKFHKSEILSGFTTETIGTCETPLPVLNKIDFDSGYRDFGMMAFIVKYESNSIYSITIINPLNVASAIFNGRK